MQKHDLTVNSGQQQVHGKLWVATMQPKGVLRVTTAASLQQLSAMHHRTTCSPANGKAAHCALTSPEHHVTLATVHACLLTHKLQSFQEVEGRLVIICP